MSRFYDANEDPEDPLEQELKARPRPQPSTSLLRLLATAQDAVSRLDALASTAPASVRAGLVVRMGWREAAGWLSSVTAWAHPLDLALRAAGVLGSFAGAGSRAARCRTPMLRMRPSRGKAWTRFSCLKPRKP